MDNDQPLDLTIIGAGMIVHDLILPAVYHLQRGGYVQRVTICGTRARSLRALKENGRIRDAFPGQDFAAYPSPNAGAGEDGNQELYKEVLARMAPHQAVILALPDQLHHRVALDALEHDQHLLCVKPLALKHAHGAEIAAEARARGLFVGVEYHKRFDRRSLVAKAHYANGDLGEFVMGEAKMIEPYYYRSSNFQNWFTADCTDPFVYVGCHYVDLVYFITGLRPVGVSVSGVRGRFPNGNEAYLWANGRVRFENGALLSVTSGLGYPDASAGPNEQGLSMFFEGENGSAVLKHNDQFRGVECGFVRGLGPTAKRFHYVNPDFFQLVPWEGEGLKPIGYGPDSVVANIRAMCRIEAAAEKDPAHARNRRLEAKAEIDRKGLIATAENSAINELVQEAARLSIQHDGAGAVIEYEPEPRVALTGER